MRVNTKIVSVMCIFSGFLKINKKKKLFKKLYENQQFWNAQIVGKNLFHNNPSNEDSFCLYFDFCIEQANNQKDIDSRSFFLNEADIALSLFCDRCNMSEKTFMLIDKKRKTFEESNQRFNISVHDNDEYLTQKTISDNESLIDNLDKLAGDLQNVSSQKDFDTTIAAVSKAENSLVKDSFTPAQKERYDALSKRYSKLVSDKMIELQWQENKEYNLLAADAIKKVYDSFKTDSKKYKKDAHLFQDLICNKLCCYDNSRLTGETNTFYNFVYQYIFNEVDEDLKLQMTKYALNSSKSSL